MCKNKKGAQDTLTKQICEMMNMADDEPLTYAFIPELEEYLQISIYVISVRTENEFSYISPNHDEERKKIFLLHDDREGVEHFQSIASLAGFFCRSRFCKSCFKPYEKPLQCLLFGQLPCRAEENLPRLSSDLSLWSLFHSPQESPGRGKRAL